MRFIFYIKLAFVFCIINSYIYSQVNTENNSNQTKEEQLATQYFEKGEFDKAVYIYEKLFNNNPIYYYRPYLQCLVELKDFSTAEDIIKKQAKKNKLDLRYTVDLGYIYKLSDNADKANQMFDKAIKELNPDEQEITTLANTFLVRKEPDYAIKTYEKGKKLLSGAENVSFNFELAEIYDLKKDFPSMLNEYIEVLAFDRNNLQKIKDIIQAKVFGNDPSNKKTEYLKEYLIRESQKNPNEIVYYDLLIWFFVQQRDFESAFIHSKALDKRNNEEGARIIYLADLCLSNKSYEIAIKAYQYVIDKGKNANYYINGKIGLLNAIEGKILNSSYTKEDLFDLEKNYISTIDELGKNEQTAFLIKEYAHLLGFYLDKKEEAVKVLEEAINLPRISPEMRAECKLEMGDILLLMEEVWDAKLYYGQVEKDFKHDVIGQEAKYRNAKLSYYIGEFDWAKAQLDVLKAATSKLIANDALHLSLLISDNTIMDTSTTALLMFAKADLLVYQNQYSNALNLLDSINKSFPYHSLSDEILFKKAEIMIKELDYKLAANYLDSLLTTYPDDILADQAMFILAELYEMKLNNIEKAKEYYKNLLTQYPGSMYTVEARKRFRILRGEENIN